MHLSKTSMIAEAEHTTWSMTCVCLSSICICLLQVQAAQCQLLRSYGEAIGTVSECITYGMTDICLPLTHYCHFQG